MIPLEHDDYREIKRQLNLSPGDWIELQKLHEKRQREKLYHGGEINVFSCLCRSPWCKKCAKCGPTANKIRDRLTILDWRCVRQVVLTVRRDKPPEEMFAHIRKRRAIARLVKSMGLSGCRWLWVLEFHRGGFPHWHLFIETTRGKGGMIGKKIIQKRWKHGIVWETYAKSEQHWQAICGYHRKAGYFAAETKAHQLELPEYLMGESRVRKYASNFKHPKETPAKPKAKVTGGEPRAQRVQKVYKERLAWCDTQAKIRKGGSWLEVPVPGAVVREKADERLEMIDYKTFRGDPEDIIDMIVELQERGK